MNPRTSSAAEATQCLQSRRCVCRRGVVAHSGHDATFPFFEIPNWAARLVVLLLAQLSGGTDYRLGV
jgi:hypothetical protein